MMNISPLATSVAALCLLTATISAHGGQYRGPGASTGRGVTPGGPGGASTPGGRSGGPITPNGAATPDTNRWQVWWELNKDPYLRAPRLAIDPKFAAAKRAVITDKQKLAVIVPALKKALDKTSNQHITSACMIALAKIGLDHPDFKILDVFRKRLRRGNQEIREVAALAMGISKQVEAMDDLSALLENTARGRELMRREKVDDRTRTFAAYGLGLIARGTDDARIKYAIYESLKRVLESKENNRDILIGVLNGLRLLDPLPEKGGNHRRLLWASLGTLEKFQSLRVGKSREAVQAHAHTAMARILGRNTGPDHARIKTLYSEIMRSRKKRHRSVYQSVAIGAGRLLLSEEEHAADGGHAKALERQFEKTRDELTRNFALIAMGQIGGNANLERLIKVFRTAKRDTRSWAALALGLLAFHAPAPKENGTTRVPDVLANRIGEVLYTEFKRTNNRDVRAATALALGLCKHYQAAPYMRKLVEKYRKIEEFAGYLCMGLALMDDKASGELIAKVMGSARLKPLLMTQTAMALARLAHPGASVMLRQMMRDPGPMRTMTLASISTAIGYLADPANVGPLVGILRSDSELKLVRAFAAVALGSMAENDSLTWSAWIAMNMNYSATVETLSNGSSGILDIL